MGDVKVNRDFSQSGFKGGNLQHFLWFEVVLPEVDTWAHLRCGHLLVYRILIYAQGLFLLPFPSTPLLAYPPPVSYHLKPKVGFAVVNNTLFALMWA